MNYLLLLWSLITSLVAVVSISVLVLYRRATKKLFQAWLADMTNKDDAIHKLVESVSEARSQRDTLKRENANLARQIQEKETVS